MVTAACYTPYCRACVEITKVRQSEKEVPSIIQEMKGFMMRGRRIYSILERHWGDYCSSSSSCCGILVCLWILQAQRRKSSYFFFLHPILPSRQVFWSKFIQGDRTKESLCAYDGHASGLHGDDASGVLICIFSAPLHFTSDTAFWLFATFCCMHITNRRACGP